MQLSMYQVDAFTDRVFHGNPAAVVPLEAWLEDAVLQAIAQENNLSETAFFVPMEGAYQLRWFSPTTEVNLCGHATLASAHVLFEHLGFQAPTLTFHCRYGALRIQREQNGFYWMDFPALKPRRVVEPPAALVAGLGIQPLEVWAAEDYLAVLKDADQVQNLKPQLDQFLKLDLRAVIVTAAASHQVDFVSRLFGPKVGVPEDPVTGSAHCMLMPYWAPRLNKTFCRARQISRRGGEVACRLEGERVFLGGHCADYMTATVFI